MLWAASAICCLRGPAVQQTSGNHSKRLLESCLSIQQDSNRSKQVRILPFQVREIRVHPRQIPVHPREVFDFPIARSRRSRRSPDLFPYPRPFPISPHSTPLTPHVTPLHPRLVTSLTPLHPIYFLASPCLCVSVVGFFTHSCGYDPSAYG